MKKIISMFVVLVLVLNTILPSVLAIEETNNLEDNINVEESISEELINNKENIDDVDTEKNDKEEIENEEIEGDNSSEEKDDENIGIDKDEDEEQENDNSNEDEENKDEGQIDDEIKEENEIKDVIKEDEEDDITEKEENISEDEIIPVNISGTNELSVIYQGHAEDVSWQDWVSNGEIAGTEYIAKRLEAIRIKLENAPENAGIMYQAHAEDISWQNWMSNGEIAGTPYQGKRLEGIRIKLVNLDEYSVEYRAHVEGKGWQDWVCDGELAGTQYQGKRLEGLQIRIVLKSSKPMAIKYQGHAENVSWQDWVSEGYTAGTTGQGLRLEAIKIKLVNAPENAGIMYQAHAEDISWQDWVYNGQVAGIEYRGKRLEGIRIKLINLDTYSVQYRGYVKGIGWQDWVHDGEIAGTQYQGKILEGLQIRLVPKIKETLGVQYQAHLQNYSWNTETLKNGRTAGVDGLNIEAIKINLLNAPEGAGIEYQAHSQYDSWLNKVEEGYVAGREYQGKSLEGIRIRLVNLDNYSVQYRAYVKNEGWQNWVYDGELAGSQYQGKAIQKLEIKIVNKVHTNSIIQLEKPEVSNVSGKEKLRIEGWTLSEKTGNSIKVYIDNIEMQADLERVQRDDVISNYIYDNKFDVRVDYGDEVQNSTPGYITEIDLSNISQGNHTLFIRLYDSNGTNIKTVSKPIVVFKNAYMGIDVSTHNGYINWQQVKSTGVEFAIIRIGYRGYVTGKIVEDAQFRNNIEGATNAGIKVGVYFFTQAINPEEAREEARWVNDTLNKYGYRNLISYPVIIDTEYTGSYDNNGNRDGRADYLNVYERTEVCKAFLETVQSFGYKPMLYASKYWIKDNLDINKLAGYDVWLAHYVTNGPFEQVTDYKGPYAIWQYTSKGQVSGISGNVDLNIGFVQY